MASLSSLFLHIACVPFPSISGVGTLLCVNIPSHFMWHLPYPWWAASTVCIYGPFFPSAIILLKYIDVPRLEMYIQYLKRSKRSSWTKEHICNYIWQNTLSAVIKGGRMKDWDEMISQDRLQEVHSLDVHTHYVLCINSPVVLLWGIFVQ